MGSNIVRNLGIRYISKICIKFCIKKISKSAPGNSQRHILNWLFRYPWSHESVRIHGTDSDLFSELCRFCSKWNTQPLYLSISYDDLHYLVTYCWFCMDFFLDKEQERSLVVGGRGGLSSCLQFNPEWESRSLATHPHPSREERDQISDKSSSWVQWQEKVMRPCRPIERVKWSIHWYELR